MKMFGLASLGLLLATVCAHQAQADECGNPFVYSYSIASAIVVTDLGAFALYGNSWQCNERTSSAVWPEGCSVNFYCGGTQYQCDAANTVCYVEELF